MPEEYIEELLEELNYGLGPHHPALLDREAAEVKHALLAKDTKHSLGNDDFIPLPHT